MLLGTVVLFSVPADSSVPLSRDSLTTHVNTGPKPRRQRTSEPATGTPVFYFGFLLTTAVIAALASVSVIREHPTNTLPRPPSYARWDLALDPFSPRERQRHAVEVPALKGSPRLMSLRHETVDPLRGKSSPVQHRKPVPRGLLAETPPFWLITREGNVDRPSRREHPGRRAIRLHWTSLGIITRDGDPVGAVGIGRVYEQGVKKMTQERPMPAHVLRPRMRVVKYDVIVQPKI